MDSCTVILLNIICISDHIYECVGSSFLSVVDVCVYQGITVYKLNRIELNLVSAKYIFWIITSYCLCLVAEGGGGGHPHEEWGDPCFKGLPQSGQPGEGTAETGAVSPGEGKGSSPE